jgi:nucleoside-diphosphate-sugar epimerase
MNVLITGGTGLLGSTLALHYARAGHRVVVIAKEATDAERENAADLRKAGVEVVLGTVTDRALLAKHCAGTDVVHHIAAIMREANIPDQVFWDVNVEATCAFLDIARAAGVGRFVYCSSIGVMGKSPPKPASEQTPCRPEDIYQVTKKAAEDLCLSYHKTHGFPIAVVRPADVYGPRDRRLLKLFKTVQKGRWVTFGSGQNVHHMVHIDDMVQGFVLAAEKDAALGEVFIIAGDEAPTIERLARVVAKELGVAAPKIKIPLLPIQLLAVVVEQVCKPLKVQPPIYPRRVDFFRTDFAFDISKAKRVLGYAPQYSLERGIRSTLAWYEERGLVTRRSGAALAKEQA